MNFGVWNFSFLCNCNLKCACVFVKDRYRYCEEDKERLAVTAPLSTQCLAWHGWCKMWCVQASDLARLPTPLTTGSINHVNNPDPRDATAVGGEALKSTPSTCGRAWRIYGWYWKMKQKIEQAKACLFAFSLHNCKGKWACCQEKITWGTTWEERMRRRELSTPLPPGVLELRDLVIVLDGENGRTLLRVEWGGTRGRDSVVFLPVGEAGELMGEWRTSAMDDLRTPVPMCRKAIEEVRDDPLLSLTALPWWNKW